MQRLGVMMAKNSPKTPRFCKVRFTILIKTGKKCKKVAINLHMSKICSNFVVSIEKDTYKLIN